MKRKVARLRLSPNEEAQLIREEHERRRKLRIQQVREQERYIALQIRQEVQRRRERELQNLKEVLKEDWERQQKEKLETLQKLYQESLQLIGQGHRSAKENEPDWAAVAQKEEENHAKAEERYREALRELKSQRQRDQEEQNRSMKARRKALQAEKERSAKVASLPPPPPNPIENIESMKQHLVKKSDVNAFSATHYHMPETAVDREADTTHPNAQKVAEVEVRRLQELGREAEREREEQLEKARLRGKHALRREQLTQDRERFLAQLEHMQQTDLLRRRQQVSQMPAQIFQPLYKRHEMREDCQREMEFAFEDMYTGERKVKGDLVLQLVPEPLPALSTDSQDQELDVTLDDVTTSLEVTPGAEETHRDTRQQTGSTEREAPAQGEPSRPAGALPRQALKKLLDRIRSQRDQWTSHGSSVPTTDQPITTTDQIPERDTTIDTGSLTSEERERPPTTSPRLPRPSQSPPVLETKEESIVAGTLLPPDVLPNRIQTYEEERKRREEELEREKQQQVALLQELEEQKARLEQMLLGAQQERETLKAAVTQEVPVHHPEVPVHEQEVTSGTPGPATEPEPTAGEDDHTRRIREYQQRLMERNRLHHRSVEVARRRLEEYQRALQIRYNLTATSALSPAVPTCPVHPPLHLAGVAVPLAPPLQLPTGSAMPAHIPEANAQSQAPGEIPMRNSAILSHPSSLPGSGWSSRASLGIDSRSLPVQLESSTESPRDQRAGITAWLTDSIMERVTDHFPERLRPSSVTVDPLPYGLFTTHQATSSIPPRPISDATPAISPGMTDGPPSLPGQASFDPGVFLRGSPQEDMERQKQELQEVHKRVLEQREAVAQQQREQEEVRRRQEEEREQMKRQREALQALINADAQPASEVADEVVVSQDIGDTRLRLLASLLRAIEESNGGTLSSLQDDQNQDGSVEQQLLTRDPTSQSDTFTGPAPPPHLFSGPHVQHRAPKPPVARVRLGIMEMMMTEQHELSAIEEVETPANASLMTGSENSARVLPPTLATVPQEEPEPSVVLERPLHSSPGSSGGEQSAGRGTGSGTGSGRSSKLSWRERLMMEAGTSPEPAAAPPSLSQSSSDSGRGGTAYPGPAITGYTSPTESTHRPDPDCLSSTTISTGSYVTTDPEQNSSQIEDTSLLLARLGVERVRRGPGLIDISPPSSQSSYNSNNKDQSAPGPPRPDIDSLFHNSSIQRIIDKYTRELDISLNTAGNTTVSSADREGSSVEEPSSSVPQQSWARVQEGGGREERGADSHSLPSDTESGAQRHGLERDNTVNQILEHFSDQVSLLAAGQESSFNPLIGQLADQSSCLAADQRDSPMERLIGQPSAHSSMIGAVTGQSVSAIIDQGGWDSTLSRMIGRLSHQSSSQWLSGGQDLYASLLVGQMELEHSSWLDGGQDESQMRPLLGVLDESGAQRSGSSGGRASVDLGGPGQTSVSSAPVSAPEAQSHSSPIAGLDLQDQTLQTASSLQRQEPEMCGVNLASDSFHPLMAEITQNETVEPSMTFHLPEEEVSSSPVGSGHSPRGDHSLSVHSEGLPEEEFETHDDTSVTSDPSPERFRAEEPSLSPPSTAKLQESLYQLTTSHCHSTDSALLASPTAQEAELAALSLSGLTLGGDSPTLDLPPEEGDPCCLGCVFPVGELKTGQPDVQQCSNQRNSVPIWDKIIEAASEKGILEESQLTLVSLTDTTLQDQETTIMEEEKEMEEECKEEEREEGQKTEKEEQLETILLPEETPASLKEENTQSCAVMLLEFHWSPSTDKQEAFLQKFHQRSAQRVEKMKAKRALAMAKSEGQGQSKTKTQSALRPVITTKLKGAQYQSEDQSSETSCLITAGGSKQEKPQLPIPMSEARLKKVDEVRICTPEQRKLEVSEMHQRTQRLYNQLEEVKHQKEIRSRQESHTNNRLKAKEFHMKTLQKLRAKQTR